MGEWSSTSLQELDDIPLSRLHGVSSASVGSLGGLSLGSAIGSAAASDTGDPEEFEDPGRMASILEDRLNTSNVTPSAARGRKDSSPAPEGASFASSKGSSIQQPLQRPRAESRNDSFLEAGAESPPPPAARGPARTIALSLRDLSEIKALKKPPPPIRMLMEVCCLLFHIQPVKQQDERNAKRIRLDYWEPARRYLLSDPFFLSKLRMYEADDISSVQRTKIKKYFQDPEFTSERVRNCSKAAYELYEWVSFWLKAWSVLLDRGQHQGAEKHHHKCAHLPQLRALVRHRHLQQQGVAASPQRHARQLRATAHLRRHRGQCLAYNRAR